MSIALALRHGMHRRGSGTAPEHSAIAAARELSASPLRRSPEPLLKRPRRPDPLTYAFTIMIFPLLVVGRAEAPLYEPALCISTIACTLQ